MTEQQSHEGMHEQVESMRSSSQLITQSLIAAQQRNLQFAQRTVDDVVDVLKSHAEATSTLLHELEQRGAAQTPAQAAGGGQLMENAVELVRRALSSYEQVLDAAGQTMKRGLATVEEALVNLETTTEQTLRGEEKTARKPHQSKPRPE